MGWLITILREVPDPRTGNATRHDLLEVLTIALTASICGCESCVEFADFAEDREQLFREFLHLENGLPSHDTFSRLLRLIDPEALSACFGRFLDALGADGGGVVAIDGKTLRRSFDRAAGASPLQVVTAFAAEAQLVIGQKAVAAASACRAGCTACATMAACCSSTCATITASPRCVADPIRRPSRAEKVRGEWVIRVDGKVKARPRAPVNANMPTGEIEVYATRRSRCWRGRGTAAAGVRRAGLSGGHRLKYRFLDLRRETLHKNIMLRARTSSPRCASA
jgi:hypothetical protein